MILNLQSFHFNKVFGKVAFCQKQINPVFDLKLEKPKEEKKDEGKKEKAQDAKKEKAAPAKKDKKADKPKPAAEPVDKSKEWAKNLPETKFNFYDFKTELVNAPDKV